jgi:hypothetical protein
MSEQQNIRDSKPAAGVSAADSLGQEGMSLPAVPVVQQIKISKNSSKTQKAEKSVGRFEQEQNLRESITQRKSKAADHKQSHEAYQTHTNKSAVSQASVTRFNPAQKKDRTDQSQSEPLREKSGDMIPDAGMGTTVGLPPVQRRIKHGGRVYGPGELAAATEALKAEAPPASAVEEKLNDKKRNWEWNSHDKRFDEEIVDETEDLDPYADEKFDEEEKDIQFVPDTVEGIASVLDKERVNWITDDDTMMDILRGPFEANWFKLRGALTMGQWPDSVKKKPSYENSLLFMNAMVDMRWRKWKAFSVEALKGMKDEVAKQAQENAAFRETKAQLAGEAKSSENDKLAQIFDPVGSMAVTSDVDLSMGGSSTEIAVGMLNREFRSHFKVPYDPGTVFDINVYAADWIHGEALNQSGGTMNITPGKEVGKMTKQAEKERDDDMEIWSLVKVARNMDKTQWTDYATQTTKNLTGDAKTAMQNKLDTAWARCTNFKDRVTTRMAAKAKLYAQEEQELLNLSGKSAFGEKYKEQARETRASNEIYQELLGEVKQLRLRLAQIKDVQPMTDELQREFDRVGKALGSKIAEALTFANEVYASEGAVQHTVLDQGAGKKLTKLQDKAKAESQKSGQKNEEVLAYQNLREVKYKLRKELFLQSANENVGDALHSLHTYIQLPFYAVYRAGKYLSRLVEATNKLIDDRELVESIPNYTAVKDVGENAMAIKTDKVKVTDPVTKEVKELEGDPEYVKKNEFFKKQKDTDAHHLETEVISYGAAIPAKFEAKKEKDKKAQ